MSVLSRTIHIKRLGRKTCSHSINFADNNFFPDENPMKKVSYASSRTKVTSTGSRDRKKAVEKLKNMGN